MERAAKARSEPISGEVRKAGRYSRQPLAPQQILDDLRDPRPGEIQQRQRSSDNGFQARRPQRSRDGGSEVPLAHSTGADGFSSTGERFRMPPGLWRDYQVFKSATRSPQPGQRMKHAEVYHSLVNLAENHQGMDDVRTLLSATDVSHRSLAWFLHYIADWSQSIASATANASAIRPLQALRASAACISGNNQYYPAALWLVSTTILEAINAEVEASPAHPLELTAELMALWNLTMRMHASPPIDPLRYACSDWSFLPDPAAIADTLRTMRRSDANRQLSSTRALNFVVPSWILSDDLAGRLRSRGQQIFDYPSAALVTLELLHHMRTKYNGDAMFTQYEQWVQLIQTIIKVAGDDRIPVALSHKLETSGRRELYSGIVRRLQLRLRHASKQSAQTISNEHSSDPENVAKIDNPETAATLEQTASEGPKPLPDVEQVDPTYRFVGKSINRLGRAVEQEDVKAAYRIYNEVKAFEADQPASRVPIELYENLLYSFLSLREAAPTASIWKDLVRAGHQPTQKTYTTMMRGCQNIRDTTSMENFWTKMRQAGIQPDAVAWATRIFGLVMSGRHVQAGMRALEEMGREWIYAARELHDKKSGAAGKGKKSSTTAQPPTKVSDLLAKFPGDVNGVPRPAVNVLNAAISALAAVNHSLIPKALSWGKSFGVEPELKTYNVLVNISMRAKRPGEAMSILKTMTDRGIQPDSTTWTVLLSATFHGGMLDGLDSAEVGERIVALVRGIDSSSSSGLDKKGYALIVDRLLKVYNNFPAAQEMLQHMSAKGLRPSAEIYTILMTHHLVQSPPDFASAESLWARMRSENAGYGPALDSTFFDRMIELYAPHQATVGTEILIGFLDVLHAQGKKLSWRATEALARAFNDAKEWDRLASVVDRARRERDGGPTGESGGFGSRSFWDFIATTPLSHYGGPAIRR